MSESFSPVVSIAKLELEPFQQGTGYQSADAGISELLGLTQIGAAYTEVPPGKSSCPFHVHHVEDEMFVILEGNGEYRFGARTYEVKAGDVLGAPRGGVEYAHKLTNTGRVVLRYLSISSMADTEICEYPDSNKFLARQRGRAPFRFIGRMTDVRDYWDGEEDGVNQPPKA